MALLPSPQDGLLSLTPGNLNSTQALASGACLRHHPQLGGGGLSEPYVVQPAPAEDP